MSDRRSSEVEEILAKVRGDKSNLIPEYDAKKILRAFGISTIEDHFCSSEEECLRAARQVGYPVAVKVVSPEISHKSDVGGVKVGVLSDDELIRCYREMRERVARRVPGASISGVLIEPVVKGHEVFVGVSRDSCFGPVMMFGLGGVLVEVLRDISYELAPLSTSEALRMIRGVRGYRILQGIRGGKPVDEDVLAGVLLKVSNLVTAYPQIEELDINPLVVEGSQAVAVDARLCVGQVYEQAQESYEDLDMEKLFSPRSVAVVGVTTERYNRARVWLKRVQEAGYKGKLYAVSRREQIDSWPTYKRVADIPEPVDLSMIEVGRDSVPSVLQDCVTKGVPWISIHSSGFSETGTSEGVELERQLCSIIRGAGTRFIGPNAMGPYCPESGIIPGDVMEESGEVAIVSQSGVTFLALGKVAKEKCFGVSRGVSYGSGADVRIHHFLEYLVRDAQTKIVAVYLEGVRDGSSFLGSLRKLAALKPTIVLKGGMTDLGARAAASHSGAMAGRGEAWSAVFKKAGAVQAETMEEMIDLLVGFLYCRNVTGKRVCIIGPSGGSAVMYADVCFRSGFQLPTLGEQTQANIKNGLPAGTSAKNPVDVAQGYFRHELMAEVLAQVAGDDNVDFILFHIPMDVFITTVERAPWVEEKFLGYVVNAKKNAKPFIVLLPYTVNDGKRAEIEQSLLRNKIAVFPTPERALKVVSKLQTYRDT